LALWTMATVNLPALQTFRLKHELRKGLCAAFDCAQKIFAAGCVRACGWLPARRVRGWAVHGEVK
jgi:hypothetical protein